MQNQLRSTLFTTLGLLIGCLTGYLRIPFLLKSASVVSELFLGALQLIAIPIVFLSILSTISGFNNLKEMKFLGRKVLKYTLLTTVIAASIALIFYLSVQPAIGHSVPTPEASGISQPSFFNTLMQMFPTNLVEVFMNNNVFGAALISASLGFAVLALPNNQRAPLHTLFASLFQALLKITSFIIRFIPLGIWAFTTLFLQQILDDFRSIVPLTYYIICVVGANCVQGIIVLPLILKMKGISPSKTFSSVYPALMTAFFSKSSSAALPLTIECSTTRGKLSKKVVNFSLPLCSVINMNGCAAFILITVLFVSAQAGLTFSLPMMFFWIILSTLAAVGNASVPMGCYFLASAFLVGLGVPIHLMGMILPIYSFIDMLETALNVWSDVSITHVVNKEALKEPSFEEDPEDIPLYSAAD
ncbi:MAG: Proton/glutamate-aspartate symporter [Chlamydiae bacterium]|nr:Proton/glutamate-aspartate symporter [Chlamydiota bacterium]